MGAGPAAGAGPVTLADAHILETGTAMDKAFGWVAGSPTLAAALPSAVLMTLLAPFVLGMLKSVARPASRAGFAGAGEAAGTVSLHPAHSAATVATSGAHTGSVATDLLATPAVDAAPREATYVRVEASSASPESVVEGADDAADDRSTGDAAASRTRA